MHDTRPIIRTHEILANNDFVVAAFRIWQPIDRTAIGGTNQIGALDCAHLRPAIHIVVAQHGGNSRLREDDRPRVGTPGLSQLDVVDIRMHGERRVRHERPRRRRPDEDAARRASRHVRSVVNDRTAHLPQIQRDVHARILDVLITLRDFVTRK